jgi:plastin-1
VENANYAIMVCRDRVLISVVNCGGLDIVDGNKKIILGIVAQLMRKHTLYVLTNIAESSGVEITDEQIVSWANDRVSEFVVE